MVVGALLYLVAYLTLTPVLRVVDRHDLENLRQIFGKVRVLWPIVRLAIAYEDMLLSLFA